MSLSKAICAQLVSLEVVESYRIFSTQKEVRRYDLYLGWTCGKLRVYSSMFSNEYQ